LAALQANLESLRVISYFFGGGGKSYFRLFWVIFGLFWPSWLIFLFFSGALSASKQRRTPYFPVTEAIEPTGAGHIEVFIFIFWCLKTGLNISGLGGLDKAYQDHSKGSLEDVWKLSRPLNWS
jgi:hypothetical protein